MAQDQPSNNEPTSAEVLAAHYRELIANDVPDELAWDLTKIAAARLAEADPLFVKLARRDSK